MDEPMNTNRETEENGLENMEQNRPDLRGPDQQIQLVLNNPDTEEDSIDLGNVFRNMKQKRRIFAWVLVLCLLVGISKSAGSLPGCWCSVCLWGSALRC